MRNLNYLFRFSQLRQYQRHYLVLLNTTEINSFLRELLFLAGDYCYVLDYNNTESMEKLQDWVHECFSEDNNTFMLQKRVFVIELQVMGLPFIIHLDEPNEDPQVYGTSFYPEDMDEYYYKINQSMSELIESRVLRIKQGKTLY